jgi:hypothetical protein
MPIVGMFYLSTPIPQHGKLLGGVVELFCCSTCRLHLPMIFIFIFANQTEIAEYLNLI